ncbi:hypothetical protein KM043_010154 [Ampulex compressa]|nr:hypothetical protein KM043_010154 [Ampulex compressa]
MFGSVHDLDFALRGDEPVLGPKASPAGKRMGLRFEQSTDRASKVHRVKGTCPVTGISYQDWLHVPKAHGEHSKATRPETGKKRLCLAPRRGASNNPLSWRTTPVCARTRHSASTRGPGNYPLALTKRPTEVTILGDYVSEVRTRRDESRFWDFRASSSWLIFEELDWKVERTRRSSGNGLWGYIRRSWMN